MDWLRKIMARKQEQVTGYTALCRSDLWELQKDIEVMMKNGWQPQGGVSISQHPFCGRTQYAQAMVMKGVIDHGR